MELRRKIFLLMLACVCCLNDSHAQHAVSDLSLRRDTSVIIRLYFRFDRSLLEKKYLTNEESLAKLDTMLNRPEVRDNLDSIVIIASASNSRKNGLGLRALMCIGSIPTSCERGCRYVLSAKIGRDWPNGLPMTTDVPIGREFWRSSIRTLTPRPKSGG